MGSHWNIILIPSDNSPNRQISISKFWLAAVAVLILLICIAGFYLTFSQILWESQADSRYRKQLAKKNLKLTERIVGLEKSKSQHKVRLNKLEKEVQKTMALSNLEWKTESQTNQPEGLMRFFTKLMPVEKNIDRLFRQSEVIDGHLDKVLATLENYEEAIPEWPTALPVSKSAMIIRGFGREKDPFSGKRSYHAGVDFSGVGSDSVFSAGDGRVISSSEDPFYGKYLRIRHNDKIETFYAHLKENHVRPGQKVKKGDYIGDMGSTGKTTGRHLHFEILVKGEKVDPIGLYLTRLEMPFKR